MTAADAARLVDRYLQLCEDRRLDEASRYLAPEVRFVFPGGKEFGSLAEMVEDSKSRYRWVRKNRKRCFVGSPAERSNDAEVTVTSLGMLYGEDLAGNSFSAIRYVDVFVLRDGRIAEQHVYNDLAERLRT
jgi:hypothetical protein